MSSTTNLEQYGLRLDDSMLIAIDLADSEDASQRMAQITQRLASLHVRPVSGRLFAVDASLPNIVDQLKSCLAGMLLKDDMAMLLSSNKGALHGVIVVIPRGTEEGIRIV